MKTALRSLPLLLALGACAAPSPTPRSEGAHLSFIGRGWARSSVNAVIFRNQSVSTFGDEQFAAYYDPDGHMVLAKRRLGSDDWERHVTAHRGNVRDAHNAISIGIDGRGYLHVAWDHHGQPLNYARSVAPGSLELGPPESQTGHREARVTYPGFFPLPDGDLAFVFRDGSSGDGDLMINRFDVARERWEIVQHPLIDGEGLRNAYVNQLAVDDRGGWHLSWTWRETPDVATNHDVVYAYSPDGGRSWQKSTGERYDLPITEAQGEIAWAVPQGSELINQTSMTVDDRGRPVIATYWRAEGEEVPQFRVVYRDPDGWKMSQVGERGTPFRLSGGGTKRIPVSRPQVIARAGAVHLIFRDEERGEGVVVASSSDLRRWDVRGVSPLPVGLWEPSYDAVLWKRDGRLHLFHQFVGQGDGETLEEVAPQAVGVLEVPL